MKISEAIEQAKTLCGGVGDDAILLRWLSELDGKLAFDFYKADAWLPYTDDDLDSELMVPFPWDGAIYVPHLEAMTYYSRGEYDKYENAREMSERGIWDFRQHVRREHPPLCPCDNGQTYERGGPLEWP